MIVPYEGIEERALCLASEMGMGNRVIYSSFHHPSLVKLKMLDASVKTGLLYSDGWIDAASYGRYTARVDALHPALYHMQDKELIPSARSLGLALHVWTVDDEEYMEALVRQGGLAMRCTGYIRSCPGKD